MKGQTTNFGAQHRGWPAFAARGTRRASCARAFTLAEVMIALAIFFMVVFAILGLVSNALRNAAPSSVGFRMRAWPPRCI